MFLFLFVHSESPPLRERVVQNGLNPGRQHVALQHGIRWVSPCYVHCKKQTVLNYSKCTKNKVRWRYGVTVWSVPQATLPGKNYWKMFCTLLVPFPTILFRQLIVCGSTSISVVYRSKLVTSCESVGKKQLLGNKLLVKYFCNQDNSGILWFGGDENVILFFTISTILDFKYNPVSGKKAK